MKNVIDNVPGQCNPTYDLLSTDKAFYLDLSEKLIPLLGTDVSRGRFDCPLLPIPMEKMISIRDSYAKHITGGKIFASCISNCGDRGIGMFFVCSVDCTNS